MDSNEPIGNSQDKQTPTNHSTKKNSTLDYKELFDKQLKFYDFVLKAFSVGIALITLAIILAGLLVYKDRQTMRQEIIADAQKAVKEATTKIKELENFQEKLNIEFEEFQRTKSSGEKHITAVENEFDQRLKKIIANSKDVLAKNPVLTTGTEREKKLQDFFNRGNAHSNRGSEGDLDSAIQDYTSFIEIDSSFVDAYNNRGSAYRKRGNYSMAIKDYSKAIQIDSKFVLAYNNRGNAYSNRGSEGDFDRAIQDYDSAIQIDSKFVSAYNNRGNAYFGKGRFDKAIQDYNKVISINPDYKEVVANMGAAYYNKGDKVQAKYWFNKALKNKGSLSNEDVEQIKKLLEELEK